MTSEIIPLSQFVPDAREGLRPFVNACSWRNDRARGPGDLHLLTELEQAVRRHGARKLGTAGIIVGGPVDLPTVGEIPERELVELVDGVRSEYEHWDVSGDPRTPLIERLDGHYGLVQEAGARYRAERDAQAERSGRESAALDEQLARRRRADDERLWGGTVAA